MEDIGNILWIVVAVGIMVANYLSKAQKARGKGSSHSGEAWPSMEEEAPQERLPHDNRPYAAESPRHEAQKEHTPASSRQPSGWPAIPGFPGLPGDLEMPKKPTAQPVTRQAQAADSATEPHNATSGADFLHENHSEGKAARQAAKRHIEAQNASKKANEDVARGLFTNEQPEEGNVLGEEFDLRRAVIYSEILKPKFEE